MVIAMRKVNEHGLLNLDWLKELDGLQRRKWLRDLLHGREYDIAADPGSHPDTILTDTYDRLDIHGQRAIARTLVRFVRDMADNPNTTWEGQAAHSLLIAAAYICDNSIATHLRTMIESGEYANPPADRADDLQFRLLQTMVAVDARERGSSGGNNRLDCLPISTLA